MQGFEIEILAQPLDNLQLSLNYGYLDPEYDEYIDGGVDVSDNRDFPYSPENTANAGLQYTVPGVAGGDLVARLDWIYVDDRVAYPDPAQNLRSQLDSYSLVNGRLSLADIPVGDGRITVAAWGKNLDRRNIPRQHDPVHHLDRRAISATRAPTAWISVTTSDPASGRNRAATGLERSRPVLRLADS